MPNEDTTEAEPTTSQRKVEPEPEANQSLTSSLQKTADDVRVQAAQLTSGQLTGLVGVTCALILAVFAAVNGSSGPSILNPSTYMTGGGAMTREQNMHWVDMKDICEQEVDSIMPADGKNGLIVESDVNLLSKLRDCPKVDVFLPSDARTPENCLDATFYASYLQARLLPSWVLSSSFYVPSEDKEVKYHELCPSTAIVYINDAFENNLKSPRASEDIPTSKKVVVVPSTSTTSGLFDIKPPHYRDADIVVCRSSNCLSKAKQELSYSNPRDTLVLQTNHTTINYGLIAHEKTPRPALDFVNLRFGHLAGPFPWKGTQQVVDCWLSRSDLPPLDLYVSPSTYQSAREALEAASSTRSAIKLHEVSLSNDHVEESSREMAQSVISIATGQDEAGFPHSVSAARSLGALVISADAPPMNRMVQNKESGILVNTGYEFWQGMTPGSDTSHARVSSAALCATVEQVVYNSTAWQRQEMAANAVSEFAEESERAAVRAQELRNLLD